MSWVLATGRIECDLRGGSVVGLRIGCTVTAADEGVRVVGRLLEAVSLSLRAAVRGIGGDLARNSASYRVKLAGVLLAAGEVEAGCAEMSAVLDAYGGISSPRLAGKLREFQRTAARIDNRAARDCAERMHETVRGSIE